MNLATDETRIIKRNFGLFISATTIFATTKRITPNHPCLIREIPWLSSILPCSTQRSRFKGTAPSMKKAYNGKFARPSRQLPGTTVPMTRPCSLVLFCAIFCAGCQEEPIHQPQAGSSAARISAAVKLRLLVVEDPELAAGIRLLSGEWSERSGGELIVDESSLADVLAGKNLAADLVIFPSRHLGTFVVRDWLRPVRDSVLADAELAFGTFLPVLRDHSIRYGDKVWGMPLGEIPLVLAWRGKLPAKLPTTWKQLDQLQPRMEFEAAQAGPVSWTRFPIAAEFIARTVAATPLGERATLFFDPTTMNAQLDLPQMVGALEQLRRATGTVPDSASLSIEVTIPGRSERDESQLSPLLAEDQVFNSSLNRWEKNENPEPLLLGGFAGRLVGVTQSTRNAASAFKLLPWLLNTQTTSQLSRRCQIPLWIRASQIPELVTGPRGAGGSENVVWLSKLLRGDQVYLLPRVPGIDEYLAALNEVLQDRESPATQVLAAVEQKWDAITAAYGKDRQQVALRRHQGIAD